MGNLKTTVIIESTKRLFRIRIQFVSISVPANPDKTLTFLANPKWIKSGLNPQETNLKSRLVS